MHAVQVYLQMQLVIFRIPSPPPIIQNLVRFLNGSCYKCRILLHLSVERRPKPNEVCQPSKQNWCVDRKDPQVTTTINLAWWNSCLENAKIV